MDKWQITVQQYIIIQQQLYGYNCIPASGSYNRLPCFNALHYSRETVPGCRRGTVNRDGATRVDIRVYRPRSIPHYRDTPDGEFGEYRPRGHRSLKEGRPDRKGKPYEGGCQKSGESLPLLDTGKSTPGTENEPLVINLGLPAAAPVRIATYLFAGTSKVRPNLQCYASTDRTGLKVGK